MSLSTYHVSRGDAVHRLDSPGVVWTNISPMTHGLPGATSDVEIYDVQTVPGQPDKVFICGDVKLYPTTPSLDFHGIAWSIDKGNTWIQPQLGGDYLTVVNGLRFNRIWIVNPSVIYITGPVGMVYKSVDGGQSFNSCTPLQFYPILWTQTYDPKTMTWSWNSQPTFGMVEPLAIHFIDPVHGVVGLRNAVAITFDGGATWTTHTIHMDPPPGQTTPDVIYGVQMSANGQEITALGTVSIEKSYDGGLTWTTMYIWGQAQGQHLTWTSDSNFYAFGTQNTILRSTDGGDTWQTVQATTPGGASHRAGHFYLLESGFYSNGTITDTIELTTDGCATSDTSWTLVPACNAWALWTAYTPPTCYLLTPCDEESRIVPFIVNNANLEQYLSGAIMICEGVFPNVTECTCFTLENVECTGEVLTLEETEYTAYQSCRTCEASCYSLTNCANAEDVLYTGTDLSAYVGDVIHIYPLGGISSDTCWTVAATDCDHPLLPVTFLELVEDGCNHCLLPCYLLTNCETGDTFLTSTDLSLYVGQVISSTEFQPGSCWEVSESATCTGAEPLPQVTFNAFTTCHCCLNLFYELVDCQGILPNVITAFEGYTAQDLIAVRACLDGGGIVKFEGNTVCWSGAVTDDCEGSVCVPLVYTCYEDCEACLPPAVEPIVLPANIRRVKPGYNTPGCPPDFTEKVNCQFSSAMYNKMAIDRYGVKICCDLSIDKWSIKKDLLDLKALYDADLCESAVVNATCPEVEIVYPVAEPTDDLPSQEIDPAFEILT